MDRCSLAMGRPTFLVIYIWSILVYLFNLQDFKEMIIRDEFNMTRGLDFRGSGAYYYVYSHRWDDHTYQDSYGLCTERILQEIKRG